MGDLMALAPAGAGTLALANARAIYAAAIGSRACYLLDNGDEAAAARAITPQLRQNLPAALDAAEARLAPTEPAAIMAKLTPALALTAGASMVGGARTEWLAAAADALRGIPADLLERGVRAARSMADHPSKIVPLVLAEVKDPWRARLRERGSLRRLADLAANPPAPAEPVERCTPEEARAIMEDRGIARAPDATQAAPLGTGRAGRAPSRADYLRMGVTADVLDAIEAEAAGAGAPTDAAAT